MARYLSPPRSPTLLRSFIRNSSLLSLSPTNSTCEDAGGEQTAEAGEQGEANNYSYPGGCAPIHLEDTMRGGGNPCCAYDGHGSVTLTDMPPSPRSVNSPLLDAYSQSGEGAIDLSLSTSFDDDGEAREDSMDLILKDRHLSRPGVHIVIGEESNEFDVVLDTKSVCDCTSAFLELEPETETSSSGVDGSEDLSYSIIASYSDDDSSQPPPPPSDLIDDYSPTPSPHDPKTTPQLDGDVPPLLPIPSLQKRVRFKARVTWQSYEMDLGERKKAMFFAPEERVAMRADWDASVTDLMALTRKTMLNRRSGKSHGPKDDDLGQYRGLEHWMSPLHWHRWKKRRAIVLRAVMNEQAQQRLCRQRTNATEWDDHGQTSTGQLGFSQPNDGESQMSSLQTPDEDMEDQEEFDYDFLLCTVSAAEVPVPSCNASEAKGDQNRKAMHQTPSRKLLHPTGSISHNDDDARERLADASKVWSKRDRLNALMLAEKDRGTVRKEELEDWNSSFSLLEV